MEASDGRESGSDSEWAIVDEAPSVQEANEGDKYVFRGDASGVAGDRATGEVSDGESIEIVPDDREVEAIEAIAEPQEQEQPLNLERVEEISPADKSTSAADLPRNASESRSCAVPLARLSDRNHWDFVAILLVALVGGFTVGFFCGSTGSVPAQPSPVSDELVRNLHLEIHVLRTAFEALQSAATASDDFSRAPPPTAVPDVEFSLATDKGRLYADFVSFQCRWRNNCRLGNAFCFARSALPEYREQTRWESVGDAVWRSDRADSEGHSELTEVEKAWGLTEADLEEQEGYVPDCLEGNDVDTEAVNVEVEMGLDPTPDNVIEDASQTAGPLPNDDSVISTKGDVKLSADAVSKFLPELESSFKILPESNFKILPESDFNILPESDLKQSKQQEMLDALTRLAALLAPSANMTALTKAVTLSMHTKTGADGFNVETEFLSLAARRVSKLAQRLELLRRRVAEKAGRAIERAQSDLALAEGRMCAVTGAGPLCPENTQGPAASAVKHLTKDRKMAAQKEKAKEVAKKELAKKELSKAKKLNKKGDKKRVSEASGEAPKKEEKHSKEHVKRDNSKPKGETNRSKDRPKSADNGKKWKDKTAKKLPEVEAKEGKSKKREKTENTKDEEKLGRKDKESVKSFEKEKTDGKKFSKTWMKENAEKHRSKSKESEKSFDKDKKVAGKGRRGDEGERKKDRKVMEEARKVGKQADRKVQSEGCDWSDREDRPPHRGTKPKGDSGPRRAFDWPSPCESLPTDWPTDFEACQSLDLAKNVSWVFARGCGREASRLSQAQSDWLFSRAAARKQSRDLPKPSEREKPNRSEDPKKAASKFAKRWFPERMVAAGKKMREAFRGMKQRAMKWR